MPTKSKGNSQPETAIDPHRLYTDEQAAEFLGGTHHQVRNMKRDGRIGYVPTGEKGRIRRVSGQDILDFIENNRVKPKAS